MRHDGGGKWTRITLCRVVFSAPFGPRIARRPPGAISGSTFDTACKPPKRRPTPRKRRVGSVLRLSTGASVKRLLDELLRDVAVLDDVDLALPWGLHLLALGLSTAGRAARLLEQAAERLR